MRRYHPSGSGRRKPLVCRATRSRCHGNARSPRHGMGRRSLTSIEFSGTGSDNFWQAYDGIHWPRFGLPRFAMAIDYSVPAMRDDRTRVQVQNPPLGGAFQPLVVNCGRPGC